MLNVGNHCTDQLAQLVRCGAELEQNPAVPVALHEQGCLPLGYRVGYLFSELGSTQHVVVLSRPTLTFDVG